MRATSVICRFLSLLDVALILLGVLMVMLVQVQLRGANRQAATAVRSTSDGIVAVDFFHVYAGTHGEERDKCYQVGPNRNRIREIRTDSAEGLPWSVTPQGQDQPNQVVMLLISDRGFDSMWGAERLSQMEKTWGRKIIPIYNFSLSR